MKKYDCFNGFSFEALNFGTPTTSKVAQALNYIKILSLSTEQRDSLLINIFAMIDNKVQANDDY